MGRLWWCSRSLLVSLTRLDLPFLQIKRKRLLKHAKGFQGRAKNCYSIAIRRVHKSWQHAYRDRKRKKRDFRRLWILRVNAASRARGMMYSRFIHGLKKAGVELNRKALSEIAIRDPRAFDHLVELAKSA